VRPLDETHPPPECHTGVFRTADRMLMLANFCEHVPRRCSQAGRQETVSVPDAAADITPVWDALCCGLPPPSLLPEAETRGVPSLA
jgi:hypothetical protein